MAWKPDQRTLVFRSATGGAGPASKTSSTTNLTWRTPSTPTASPPSFREGTKENIPVTLTQVDGEWRISEIPDGTAIPEETFKVIYGAYPIYFYDPSFTYAVPDVRWFIKKKTVKAMTSALLGGPAPYLKGAVVSAFPSGMKLARESVPVVSGAAQVDLTAKELVEASSEDRLRMQTQLALTFRSQPDVINVELRANQDLVRVEDNGSVLPPVRDKNVPARQIAVSNNELVRYENNRISPLPDIQSVAALAPRFPGRVARLAVRGVPQRTAGPRCTRSCPGSPRRALTTRDHPHPPVVRPVRLGLDGRAGRQRRHRSHGLPAHRRGRRRRRAHRDAGAGLARRTHRQGVPDLPGGGPRARDFGAERQDHESR